jgi:hypothetical protein
MSISRIFPLDGPSTKAEHPVLPIVHNTTYEALRDVSPMLASRTGLDTAEDSMSEVTAKIAELVAA